MGSNALLPKKVMADSINVFGMLVGAWDRIVCQVSCPKIKKFMKNSADLACRVRPLAEKIFGVSWRIYKRASNRQIIR